MNEIDTHKAAMLGAVKIVAPSGKSYELHALPVRAFDSLSDSLQNEPELVALFTGLPPEEVDALPMGDFEKIVEEGLELNLPPFSRWTKRRRALAERLFGSNGENPTHGANGASTLPTS